MQKYVLLMVLIFTGASCTSAFSEDNTAVSKESPLADVQLALTKAEHEQDYRLLVTATRGITVPGLNPNEFKSAIALCGKQYMPKTGDVIKTEQDRVERNKVVSYMQQYNEHMWSLCRKYKTSE